MLWVKAFHIIFVVCWFACLFYLPRLFVNYAIAEHEETRAQLRLMQRKLFRFSVPFAVLTVVFGIGLVLTNPDYYLSAGWFHAKIALVVLLLIYHGICGYMVLEFESGAPPRSHVFYRWFNEIPTFILFGAIILVVLKPF